MSSNLEETIQRKVHKLLDEQQREVLEFVNGLAQNADRTETPQASMGARDGKKRNVDLREHGISREQAAELRAGFATFEDWSDPEMEIYDDYDQHLAALNQDM